MFGDWRIFYQATAEAAATLTGLVFVVATLTGGRDAANAAAGQKLFTTPTIFHLVSVLVVSALAWMHVNHAAYGVALCLLVLLIVAIRNAWDLVTWLAIRRDPPGEGPR